MVAVFKTKYDILIFWAECLEMVRWQINYDASLVYQESTATKDIIELHIISIAL